jgi:hypothetical protein
MSRLLDRTSLLALLLCSVAPVMVTGAIQVLPSQVALILASWVLASVPLGIGIGHCVFTGD